MTKKFTLQDAITASRDLTGKTNVPSYMKWSGNKNHPEYLRGYRTAFRNAGRNRRFVDPFVGSASIALNVVPGEKALLSDFDDMNVGMHNAVKEGKLGDELDFSDFMQDGVVNRKDYFEKLRGGTPYGRALAPTKNRSYPLDVRWPPEKGSLNYIINELNEAGINPASNLDAIKAWAKMQNVAFRGDARFNQKPARGVKRWYNMSANEENIRPVKRNYHAYQPLMENFDFINRDVFDFLNNEELDSKGDLMAIDSPYIEEAGNYDHGIDHRKLARILSSLKDDGMPIVATNSESARPLYEDEGFDTFLMDRRNNSGAKSEYRGVRPEMVAVTPGLISEREWKGPRKIQKMGYAGMPLDETSAYYDYIAERLGLGEPFDTGEQRRVFNIPNQPNFVAKVVNSEGLEEGKWPPETYTFNPGETDSGMWEDFSYRKLAALIPNTAKKFLVPGETMGHEENVRGVVRQPRVNVHEWNPDDPRNTNFYHTKARDWHEGFLDSAREELEHAEALPMLRQNDPIEEANNHPNYKPRGYRDISRFMQEQDYGPGNFSEDMRLLDYYWPYSNEGDVFG